MCKRERLAINVLPVHKQAIQRIAEADGESVSVILRRLIRKEAKERSLWPEAQAEGKREELRSCH